MTTKSTSRSREERSAGYVLFHGRGDRRYLLLRHRHGEHWAFPKGRIEAGEDIRAAAVREIREETGITDLQEIGGFRAESRYVFLREGVPVSKTVVYLLAEAPTLDVLLSDEHTDAVWLAASEARMRLTYEEGRRVLDEAEEMLSTSLKETDR